MTRRKLKYAVGLFLVISHFGLIALATGLYFEDGFSIDEYTTVLAILTPVFAGYTTSILAFIISDAEVQTDSSPSVSRIFSCLSFALPSVLITVLGLSVMLKAFNKVFADFEDFKRFLLLMESLFAGYAGMFVYSLFEKRTPVGTPNDRPPASQP